MHNINGVILINKEKGISSFGVVSKIRKILNVKKVGHCGTLDPEATGVLPIMIGNATKISKYLIEHDKTYIAILKIGIKTDTADGEGNILQRDNFILDKNESSRYNSIFKTFLGKSKQIPPMYSAIKVDGKKLYEYAREGKEVNLKERNIEIYDIEILDINYEENEIKFQVSCSKGTYIRSLCEDIALKIGTVGYMKDLKRTIVDKFSIDESITLKDLEENSKNIEFIKEYLISIENIFGDCKDIFLNNRKMELFLNGVKLTQNLEDGIYRVYNEKKFVGLGIIKNNLLKRDVIDIEE